MGLAPYGKPIFVDQIKEKIIDIKEDGTFKLDISYFKFHRGIRMTSTKFHRLFGSQPIKIESELTQFYMDMASSTQSVTEEIIIKLAASLQKYWLAPLILTIVLMGLLIIFTQGSIVAPFMYSIF